MILKFNLKSILKSFKLNESSVSMVLGAVVIVVVGILITNYFKDQKGSILNKGENTTGATNVETYLVAKGDSLWKIAEETTGSGYNWVKIAEDNNIENAGMIFEGQELVINIENNFIAETEDTDSQNSISGSTYEVQKGDTLWDIAVRAYGDGYKWSEISRENNLSNPNVIHSGNILTLAR